MYDILQLNDMLVPELLDIAEQQDISNAKKLEKQELIYKILDKQTSMSTEKKEPEVEKTKRKRIHKSAADDNSGDIITTPEVKEAKTKKTDEKKEEKKKLQKNTKRKSLKKKKNLWSQKWLLTLNQLHPA